MAESSEKRSVINLITPIDIIENYDYTFLLVCPSDDTKEQFQNLIDNFDFNINVYLYEEQEELELDWLFNVRSRADIVILDIDNFPPILRDTIGHLIGYSNTYWLTKSENLVYNKISSNKIYNLDWLYEYIQRRQT
jgi:hypothetical protein